MKRHIEIFFSYAHEDERLMDEVRRQLIVEERNGRIIKWHDRKIPPGIDWKQQIDRRLDQASIILLFLSPHFIESLYCYEIEGQAALKRHEAGLARIIPIILRPCMWESTPFSKLQALPQDAKPVTSWPDLDEVCLEIAKGVMRVVDELSTNQESVKTEIGISQIDPLKTNPSSTVFSDPKFVKVERLMAPLIEEMRNDLRENQTTREFVVLKHGLVYNSKGPYLAYYLDEHDDLMGKLKILENLRLIRDITYNNVQRFLFEEEFVDYLTPFT